METFNETISDRVVRSSADTRSTKEASERGEKITFELSAAVGGDDVRNAKSSDPMGNECLCDGFSRNSGDGDGFWPTSELVDACEKVGITIGRR